MAGPSDPASAPDFRILFESTPGLFLVLRPDFSIVACRNERKIRGIAGECCRSGIRKTPNSCR